MNKIWDKENNQLFLLLIFCFVTVYYLPVIISRVVFMGFLLFMLRTKKDYFWLAWFFILNDAPGLLFSSSASGAYRLPLYSFGKGFSFGFQELFIIVYLYKMISQKQRLNFVFKKHFIWFFSFGAGMILFSMMLGMSLKLGH